MSIRVDTVSADESVGTNRIFVVDDEATIRHALTRDLQSKGCDVVACESGERALEEVRQSPPAVVLLDIKLPGINGLEVLAEIKRLSPSTEIVMMTSHASVETAIQAIRDGAYDYLHKPFDEIDEVWITVRRAIEKHDLSRSNRSLSEETALRNKKLAEAVERLTSMVDATRRMAEFDSVDSLTKHFVDHLATWLEIDRISLMLVESGSGELVIAAHRGLDEIDVKDIRIEVGHGIAGRVADTGEPFLVTDVEEDGRLEGQVRTDLSDSFISAPIALSVPLRSGRRVLGVVNLTNRRNGSAFDEGDLDHVMALSSHLAVTIEKVVYLEELREAVRSLQQAQEQLVFAERLKVVGEMSAGLAHDFNNLLAVITGRAQIAKSRLARKEIDVAGVRSNLDTITMAALQGSKVVDRIRGYTATEEHDLCSSIDLNDAVRSAVELTQPRWKDEAAAESRAISIKCDFCDSPRLSANVYEITQAISNLILNSVEALPEGGTIQVRTRKDDSAVVLEVEDDGTGMTEETRARIFEPFFTKKPGGQGLGATIMRGIVHRQGGEVGIETESGRGSTVTLRFGTANREEVGEPVSEERVAGEARVANILLVDDDDLVRETYDEALQTGNHTVLPCSSGRQALQFYDHMKFDVVITDLSMGEMSGLELARRIKERDDSMPIILLSGWVDDYADGRTGDVGIDLVLKKPCPFEKLLAAVQTVVDRRDSA